jgi:eukaryotic-like serine/threonine-protein kinase
MSAPAVPLAADDPRVIAALDEYVAALEAGARPDRAAFLAARPDIAEPLAACLDGLDLMQQAAAQLDPLPADAELARATPLGDFRLLRVLGRGGMGVVYEAEQLSLGRRVALKVLSFAAALDPKQLQRFKYEAQAAASLHHAHIVPVYGVGCERGVHYYAMQLIDGRSLAEVLRELRDEADAAAEPGADTAGRAAVTSGNSREVQAYFRRAARLALQAARALEHAHQLGVVHRDVKPANLLLDAADHLWVTDFGLAQFHGQAGLTLTGDVLGTLRYMSPEQASARREAIDHRTDIYSLGATLYELLTLRPAVGGTDREALVRQIADAEPVPPRKLRPAVPVDLETIVLKALAKSPADRYATAQEMADDLDRFLADRPVTATRPSVWKRLRKWARRHQPVVVTAAVAGVVLLVTAVVVLSVGMARVAREEREKDEALAEAKANLRVAERQRARAERNSEKAFAAIHEMLTQVALNQVSRFPQMDRTRRELLEQALRFYQGFVQEGDPDPAARSETARAYALMARIHATLGRPAEAEQAARNGLAALEGLAADFPADPKHRAALADLHEWWGLYLRTVLDRSDQATDHLGRAVALYEELATEDPPAFRAGLATAYHNLAYHRTLASPDRQEAERLYRKALDLQEGPHRPGGPGAVALAETCNSLGILLRLNKRPAEAEPLHRRALELCGPGARGELARSHFHLALALSARGQSEEAVDHAAAAVALRQAEADEAPLEAGGLMELAPSYRALAQLLERAGRRSEAAAAYDQAARLADRLLTEFPERPDGERTWIDTRIGLVRFHAADDPAAADADFLKLREFHPKHGRALNDLAWHLATAADARFRDARRAVELAEEAVAKSPKAGTYRNTLGVARYRAGDWPAAVADLEESRRLLNRQFDSFNTFFLAMARWQQGDRAGAREWYDEAVRWMDQNQPKDAELVRFRAEAADLLGVR